MKNVSRALFCTCKRMFEGLDQRKAAQRSTNAPLCVRKIDDDHWKKKTPYNTTIHTKERSYETRMRER
jgi:hypothetical protein